MPSDLARADFYKKDSKQGILLQYETGIIERTQEVPQTLSYIFNNLKTTEDWTLELIHSHDQ